MDTSSDDIPERTDAFELALDALLTAWSDGEDPSRETLLQRHPQVAGRIAELFELAREIALFRPRPVPSVPGFDVVDEAGRGGMGVVYRARQEGLDRLVALKVLPESMGLDPTARARLLAEARGLGRVRHPNVMAIHDVVETSDVVAYAMEWIDGRSLASLLEELGDWPRRSEPPEARFGGTESERLPAPALPWFCRLGAAIARALAEVHRHELVHRDVKPGNVLLRSDGTPLLSDFGLVRSEALGLTRTGQVLGTPAFAAPEQLRGGDAEPTADIYGLGATLHCALSGQVPFAGRNEMELLAAIESRRRTPLTRLGLPKDLETIVSRCLEPEPEDRYQTADAVADDLENLLALRPIHARPLSWTARCAKAARRHRTLVLTGMLSACAVATLAIAAGLWLWNRITIPERFEALVLQARSALLEPTHSERVELARRAQGAERSTAFQTSGGAALAAYDEALRLASRTDTRLERDVVAAAQQLLFGRNPAITTVMEAAAPHTARAAKAWSRRQEHSPADIDTASRTDRLNLGLLAFLTGHTNACHRAWRDLELGGDPFVDAASGQMHLQRGEVGKAYARLTLASHVWPEAGFLAVSMADCAIRLGDVRVGARQLARAATLRHKDPFDSHIRVRADLLAAQGNDEAAQALYEWSIDHHTATTARLHYLPLLQRTGNQRRLVEVLMDLDARGAAPADLSARVEAWRWWRQLAILDRIVTIDAMLDQGAGILPRFQQAFGPSRKTRESSTGKNGDVSLQQNRANLGLRYLTETTMHPAFPSQIVRNNPEFRLRLATALGLISSIDPNALPRLARAVTALARSRAWPSLLLALIACLPAPAQTAAWSAAGSGPAARQGHAQCADPATGTVMVFGGWNVPSGTVTADHWSWNGTAWTQIAATTPPARAFASAVSIPGRNEVILFGGWTTTTSLADTWRWDGTSWTQIASTAGSTPAPRHSSAMAYDPVRDRVVLFGGRVLVAGTPNYFADTWELDPSAAAPTWTQVLMPPTAPMPSARSGAAMAFDCLMGKVLLNGGNTASSALSNETWDYDGVSWTLQASSGPALWGSSINWDASRQQLFRFGGQSNASPTTSNAWVWQGAAWQLITQTPPAPSARAWHGASYHEATQSMVLFGGFDPATGSLADTWTATSTHAPRIDVVGPGCNPAATQVPELRRACGTGPWLGSQLDLQVSNQPTAPSLNLWFFDITNPGLTLTGGCTLMTGLGFSQVGGNQLSLSIPNAPSACGTRIYFQAVSIDLNVAPLAPGFVTATSNGLSATIGTR